MFSQDFEEVFVGVVLNTELFRRLGSMGASQQPEQGGIKLKGSSARAWCRTPRAGWTVKRPGDLRITGAQLLWCFELFYGEVTGPFTGSYSSPVDGRLCVSASFIANRCGL